MRRFSIVFFLFFAVSLSAAELLSEAPKGFLWKQMPFIKMQLLMPSDWFFTFYAENKEERYLYYITKENIEQMHAYQTGLNLRVFRNVPAKLKGQLPSEYSAAAVAETAKKVKFTRKWEQQKGMFKEIGYTYTDNTDEKNILNVYRLYIANDKTGTVYILTFEGPTNDWDEIWKNVGDVIYKNISIDETI
ncbi:MAG TPA: hypothetical protein DCZ94_10325 [Lentisphaeria bacterium]|nr:MAG: hypothetical protein A2X48_23855 [Lentisphaerae bacterium GWF2_49_21]HBC87340.1 hypothetical protein [Lentisphaeria bacterium]